MSNVVLSILFFSLQWAQILGTMATAPAEDQFGQRVQWEHFSSKPFVLVIADHAASESAVAIGAALHMKYNGYVRSSKEHLQTTNENEKLKVVPVAALPDVPGIFKGLFRIGFRKQSDTGVILDWSSRISEACGYKEGKVRLALKLPNSAELQMADVRSESEALAFVATHLPPPLSGGESVER